jgi:hypothetical protein
MALVGHEIGVGNPMTRFNARLRRQTLNGSTSAWTASHARPSIDRRHNKRHLFAIRVALTPAIPAFLWLALGRG